MSAEFEDIKIVGLDDRASGASGEGALLRMVLKLSVRPQLDWARGFDHLWKQHLYAMKRSASVKGETLVTVCSPAELEDGLLAELQTVVAQTNAVYRDHLNEQARQRASDEAAAKRVKEDLASLKGRLKFD